MAKRNLKVLNKDIPEQMGVVVKVTNKKLFFNIEDRVGIKHLIEWIRGERYTKVVLPIRTDAEINHPQNVPHEKVIGYFKKEFNKINKFGKVIEENVFLFIQDPWPDPLKPFNIDDKTLQIASDTIRIKGITQTAVGDLLIGAASNGGYTRLAKPASNNALLTMGTSGSASWTTTIDGGTF